MKTSKAQSWSLVLIITAVAMIVIKRLAGEYFHPLIQTILGQSGLVLGAGIGMWISAMFQAIGEALALIVGMLEQINRKLDSK